MKLKKVDVNEIVVPEVRVTAVYDEEQQRLLTETIDKLGILQPVVLTKNGSQYIVVDGLHRLQEARDRKEEQIEAVVYDGDEESALLMNLVLNRVRGKVRASEMVEVIKTLTGDYGLDSEAIKEKTGLPREYIEKLWKIAEAAPAVRQALDDDTIRVGHAYEISRLPAVDQQEEMVAKMGIYRLTTKETKEFVDKVLVEMETATRDPIQPREPLPLPLPHCQGCDAITEPRFLQPVALCPDCYGIVWNKRKQAVDETVNAAPETFTQAV